MSECHRQLLLFELFILVVINCHFITSLSCNISWWSETRWWNNLMDSKSLIGQHQCNNGNIMDVDCTSYFYNSEFYEENQNKNKNAKEKLSLGFWVIITDEHDTLLFIICIKTNLSFSQIKSSFHVLWLLNNLRLSPKILEMKYTDDVDAMLLLPVELTTSNWVQ